jgi:Txe/YoeB family toxin of Txe-Axe toxin-antitoxin module
MKVIRENNTECYPFYKFLEDLSNNYYVDKDISSSLLNTGSGKENNHYFIKYNYIFNILSSFDRETLELTDTKKIYASFKKHVKKILPTKESSLLFFDHDYTSLLPLDKNSESTTNTSINSYYKEGILNNIFEKKLTSVLPLLSSYESQGSKYNFLVVPVFEENKRRGLFALLTTSSDKNISEFDKKLVEVLLLLAISRLDKSILRKKISAIHEELKTYQAKLSNDYRLAAIGEMTKGIVEDILSPLQVIVSQVDLLNKERHNNFEVDLLKAQIRKINETVNRLVKFVDTNPYNIKVHPCNLNEAITDFYSIFRSTLQNHRIECELDLQEDIPPILSHSNYLTQILTHLFGMIKNKNKGEGAVVVQTRFQAEEIVLKLVSSVDLSDSKTIESENTAGNLNIKIIDNLMLKHEGKCSIVTTDIGSSVVTLTFPLRRKLRV